MNIIRTTAAAIMIAAVAAFGQEGQRPDIFGGRSLLDAHNAYPEEGRWKNRLDRAIATGSMPIVIEQDIAWSSSGVPVVSHDTTLDGTEPTLENHFFKRVIPILERAIRAKDRLPLIVLHLDVKTNERAHHRAIWELLQKHRQWLTTAPFDNNHTSSMTRGPLMVITENGENQEKDFTEWAAADGTLLLFGTIPGPAVRQSDDADERARLLINASPQQLIPAAATSYRRWVNFPWMVIEEGGPPKARDWNDRDEQRLRNVVDYAHRQGLFIRFYTLDGISAADSLGWTDSYNFGSRDAVTARWRAAIRAQVDLIATDQYEDLAALLKAAAR